MGALAVSDSLKPESVSVVAQLHARGLHVWMISGDNVRTAMYMASQLGLDLSHVVAAVQPDGKLAKVQELRDGGAVLGAARDVGRADLVRLRQHRRRHLRRLPDLLRREDPLGRPVHAVAQELPVLFVGQETLEHVVQHHAARELCTHDC